MKNKRKTPVMNIKSGFLIIIANVLCSISFGQHQDSTILSANLTASDLPTEKTTIAAGADLDQVSPSSFGKPGQPLPKNKGQMTDLDCTDVKTKLAQVTLQIAALKNEMEQQEKDAIARHDNVESSLNNLNTETKMLSTQHAQLGANVEALFTKITTGAFLSPQLNQKPTVAKNVRGDNALIIYLLLLMVACVISAVYLLNTLSKHWYYQALFEEWNPISPPRQNKHLHQRKAATS